MVFVPAPNVPPPAAEPLGGFAGRVVYVYLLRVPLLIAVVLVGFPFFALWSSSGRALFENLFELDAPATCITTVAAVVLAWSLLLTGRLVLLNGEERFGTRQWLTQNNLSWLSVLIAVFLAAPMITGQFFETREFQSADGVIRNAAAVGLGLVIAYVIAFLALMGAVFASPQGTQTAADSFPSVWPMQPLFRWADHHSIFNSPRWRRLGRWLIEHVSKHLWAGYLDPRPRIPDEQDQLEENPGYGLPWSGVWLATTFAISTFILYYSIDFYKKAHLGEPTSIPALAFVLLLLLNMNWILSFLCFFLDRFRIPLLIPLVILAYFGSHSPASDHYYQIQPGVSIKSVRPHEALEPRLEKPIIVVAIAGGGIQAAAWTAQVLTGLQRQSGEWHGNFADSVALISSVSGGAAGALFFLNEYGSAPEHSGFQLADRGNNFSNLVRMASDPSLDDVAWGLVYRDLPRVLTPYGVSSEDVLLDRGRMLELSWQNRSRIFANLSNWRDGVKEGWRPATIFNATIAETGEPFLLATTDLDRKAPRNLDPKASQPNRKNFYDEYPNADLPLITAVRLAASFPYVTPAARAQTKNPEYHIVDGGYYDNYGVASVIEWLDEAFEALKTENKYPSVLVLQIRSFPDDALEQAQNHGWFFQAYAPVTALMGVRTTAQLVRDRDQLLLLRNRWGNDPATGLPRVRFAGFQFTESDAPLSWKMNKSQTDEIGAAWKSIVKANGPDLEQVRCMFEPSGENCGRVARLKQPW